MSFTWRDVKGKDDLPDGVYAADAVDQHRSGWCGCCFLVSAGQVMEDRANIRRAKEGLPPRSLSMQGLMDHFQRHRSPDESAGWNVCQGGVPLHVFECVSEGHCPLDWSTDETCERWMGYARRVPVPSPSATSCFHSPRRLFYSDVLSDLLEHGPLVLEIAAQTVLSCDSTGLVTDLTSREPNHAVSVVGYLKHPTAGFCWIGRNSWGKTNTVPSRIPRDYRRCTGVGRNECKVSWNEWVGDPKNKGFFYLPFSFRPLYDLTPSPWVSVLYHCKR